MLSTARIADFPPGGGVVGELGITASAFVPLVAVEHPKLNLDYDDNYFALEAGVTRTVRARHTGADLDPAELTVRGLYRGR